MRLAVDELHRASPFFQQPISSLLVQQIRTLGLADPTTGTRFFLVPANTHAAGQALTQVDWATAIMDWVEKGTAPSR